MNIKNSTPATNEIRPVTQINPDFTHRYCTSFYADSDDLADSINLMANRALSVLALISEKFARKDTIINNHVIHDALSSVEHELRDIQSCLKALSDFSKQ